MRKKQMSGNCFFQLIRHYCNKNIRLKLLPSKKLAFPTTDIEKLENNELYLNFFGLTGVDSPLPENLLRNIHQDEKSIAWKDFLSLFNSRLYELFFLLWKKYHPITINNHTEQNQYLELLSNLSGRKNFFDNQLLFQFFNAFLNKNQTKMGLCQIVNVFLNISCIAIQELTLSRSTIHNIKPLSSLNPSIVLGENSLLGSHIIEAKSYIKIIVHLNNLAEYRSITSSLRPLSALIEKYLGPSYQHQFAFIIPYVQDNFLILGSTEILLGFSWLLGSSNTRPTTIINNIPLILSHWRN